VSNSGSDGSPSPAAAFRALDDTVSRAAAEILRLRDELGRAQARITELEGLLKGIASGDESPGEMKTRLTALEAENADLSGRLELARASVDRMLARIRFLEEQR